jgi:DNA sulfur modification protein DndD
MILERVALRDFCLFRGEQAFDLTPSPAARNGAERRIVLFGGVNGAGKTTLLDAVQLALYGPRARCSKRANLTYDQFLRHSIHHGVSEKDGAMVSLSFRYAAGGEQHTYDVSRTWTVQKGKIREVVQVALDGLTNGWHSVHWGQLVEDFFPLEVSQLFFFDAEKIRSLAEDETSSQVLATAVKALLGLDVVERLISDADAVQSEITKDLESAPERDDRAEIEREEERLKAELDLLRTKRSELENLRRRSEAEVQQLEHEFAAAGGKHWEKRSENKRRQEQFAKDVKDCDSRLVAAAATDLPLCLVEDLLELVERQDEQERIGAEVEVIKQILAERDNNLLAMLAEMKAGSELVQSVKKYLAADRKSRSSAARDVAPRLMLSSVSRSMLHQLRVRGLAEFGRSVEALLRERSRLQRQFESVDKVLSITPADDGIGQFLERLRAATERMSSVNEESKQLDRVIAERKSEWETNRAELQAIGEREAKQDFVQDDRRRMSRSAARTKVIMREFLARATERKIDRLSDLITESFRFLLRKQTMVERIHIDPEAFAITLFNHAGHALARERLSEGEKQIFAIAVLWGLARASAHPLPAIIDTPMARLDAAHRRHLVERYFPNASHQVLILSTDTEVDRHYYQALEPHIARAYHLAYDEQSRATHGEEGYFWEPTASATATEQGSPA